MARVRIMALTGAMMLALPLAATAQDKGKAGDGQTSAEIAATRSLNQQQVAAAAEQNAANAAGAAQFNQSVADYEAARTAASQARAAYEAELEANRQARAAYDSAYAQWQADVAACSAGDYARCQTSAPK
jgi:hypothetical protein